MDNLEGPLFTDLAAINDSVTIIVTKTEILALVSVLSRHVGHLFHMIVTNIW